MATPPISARVPFTPVKLTAAYDANKIYLEHGKIARAIPPMSTTNVIAAYTAKTTDDTIVADTTAGNFAILLPLAAQAQFWKATIVNIGTGTLTVTGTISGVVNPTLAQWKATHFQSDGVRYIKIGGVV
jgi:hypothetical protein